MWRNLNDSSCASYLSSQLPNAVNKLDKDGRAVSVCVVLITMADTQLEAVTKAQPLFLEQNLKTTNGAVIAVQHEHGQGGELAGPVPAVAAVHHHRGFPRLHLVCDPQRSCENQLQRKKNAHLIQGSVNCRDPLLNPPWCARASEWTPGWRASGNPRCWDRPRPLTCGVTLSSRGCCECPRKTAQRSDTHLHFRSHPLSSEDNSRPTRRD